MSKRLLRGFLFAGCALLSGCAASSSDSSLEQQVQQQDMQIRQMQPAQADTMNQVQAMRQELDSLRGQLDELQRAGGARTLAARVERQDAALRQIENSMAIDLKLDDPAQQADAANQQTAGNQTSGAVPGQEPGMAAYAAPAAGGAAAAQIPTYGQPSTNNYGQPATVTAPAGTQPWGGNQAAAPVTPQPQASAMPGHTPGTPAGQAPSDSTWGKPSPQPAAAPAPVEQKDISLALFDAGVNSYNARNYSEAQRSFSDFMKNYKTHNLAGDAQYYLAECYFQRNQFSDAALAYNEVITKYPKSKRAPGAYLKQGISFSKSGQKAAARARMQELIKKFPSSPEAARAKSFLKTNG